MAACPCSYCLQPGQCLVIPGSALKCLQVSATSLSPLAHIRFNLFLSAAHSGISGRPCQVCCCPALLLSAQCSGLFKLLLTGTTMLQVCCSDRMVYCRASIHAQLGLTSIVSRCRQCSHTVHVKVCHWSGPANLQLQLRPPPVPLWCHHLPCTTSSCVLAGFGQHRIAVSSPSTGMQWVWPGP